MPLRAPLRVLVQPRQHRPIVRKILALSSALPLPDLDPRVRLAAFAFLDQQNAHSVHHPQAKVSYALSVSNDEPFDKPGRKPAPPRHPKPGQRVWTLTKDGRRRESELRCHCESYGWETQTLENGELSTGRHFQTYALAMQWADLEREALERDGWD